MKDRLKLIFKIIIFVLFVKCSLSLFHSNYEKNVVDSIIYLKHDFSDKIPEQIQLDNMGLIFIISPLLCIFYICLAYLFMFLYYLQLMGIIPKLPTESSVYFYHANTLQFWYVLIVIVTGYYTWFILMPHIYKVFVKIYKAFTKKEW